MGSATKPLMAMYEKKYLGGTTGLGRLRRYWSRSAATARGSTCRRRSKGDGVFASMGPAKRSRRRCTVAALTLLAPVKRSGGAGAVCVVAQRAVVTPGNFSLLGAVFLCLLGRAVGRVGRAWLTSVFCEEVEAARDDGRHCAVARRGLLQRQPENIALRRHEL